MQRAKLGRVTIARQPRVTGLRAVTAGPRGWDVRINGERVISVYPLYEGWGRTIVGWYFAGSSVTYGVPHINTCGEKGVSEEDAKARAVEYVKRCLAEAATPTGSNTQEGNDAK